ncbi:helix-turn-helix transcriptional regulator [Streptomyces sp. CC210A]|uniref:helix-turn-helix domain-containing protein n=1 Tax=Streptomyces sp. CC210A TaxID=2898184 RepID=UPI001F4420FB|nr:helix-turn-helix transcriptional regulator [Streptomyces sp. CC210A]
MATDLKGEADEPGWEVDPDDESGAAVVAAVGRQLKLRREAAGLKVAQFADAIGYGEDLVYKVEAGRRIPRPEYLDKADKVLTAGGLVAAMKKDVEAVRYPKRIRDLVKLEAQAVELLSYCPNVLHGLLQTPEYARALMETQRPALSDGELDRGVAFRMARKSIFERTPLPDLNFVLEEAVLRRPVGGRMVHHRQLEHLLEVGRMRHVGIQVMPTEHWEHQGTGGRFLVLKFGDGSAVGRTDDQYGGGPVSNPRFVRVLELRYGIIRGQALPPPESRTFIENLLEET